ncbi:intermembrane phospholipid transport protein YdbH family protein [Aliikangiella sp. IMCC44359]|uniref:intermembrane phospholipid transport protein YdbH family protein n=1 Tax=Aliikangiella sp. IMCC44359 TaxID=3459125 RepID=UPI00403ABBCC
MIKLTRNHRIGIIFLLIFFTVYASFPWWAAYVIKKNLPLDWRMTNLSINYPSVNGLSLAEFSIETTTFTISAKHVIVDYQFKKLAAEYLNLKIKKANVSSTPISVNIPQFNLNEYLSLSPFNQITINKVDINTQSSNNSQSLNNSLSSIALNINDTSKLNIHTFYQNDEWLQEPVEINLSIFKDKEITKANLLIAENKLASLNYNSTQHSSEIFINLEPEHLFVLLKPQKPFAQFSLSQPVSLKLLQDNQTRNLMTTINYQGAITIPELKEKLETNLTMLSDSNSYPFQFNTNVQLEAHQTDFFKENFFISSPKVNTNFQLEISPDNVVFSKFNTELDLSSLSFKNSDTTFTLDNPKIKLTNDSISLNNIENNDVNLSINITPTNLHVENKKNQVIIDTLFSLDATFRNLFNTAASGSIKFEKLKISEHYQSDEAKIQLNFDEINHSLSKGNINIEFFDSNNKLANTFFESLNIHAEAQLTKENINAKGNLKLNNINPTSFDMSLNRHNNHIKVTSPKHSFDLISFNSLIAQFNQTPLGDISIQSGKIEHQSELNIPSLSLNSTSTLKQAEITFNKNKLINLNLETHANALKPLSLKANIRADKIALASGLDISKLNANLIVHNSVYKVNNLNVQLMSGDLSSQSLTISNNELEPSQVQIKHLSLDKLTQFLDINGLTATGNINLELPLKSQKQNIVVNNATFNNIEQGVIKYKVGSLGPSDNIALKALSNFHYQQLDGTINYDQYGKYKIKLHLLGSNPELYDGYPIDFILNLNGKLDDIFKSLFLTGNFEEAIMEQVKAQEIDN